MSQILFACRIASVEALTQVLDGLESTGQSEGWAVPFQMQLALVAEELMVNALVHGGQAPGQGWCELQLSATDDGVTLLITDNGLAFDPFSVATPDLSLDLDSRAIGGLGLHFVREMTDSQSYQRQGQTNAIKLFKRFDSGHS
jgi:serine/threonine-protein kinase RsbW